MSLGVSINNTTKVFFFFLILHGTDQARHIKFFRLIFHMLLQNLFAKKPVQPVKPLHTSTSKDKIFIWQEILRVVAFRAARMRLT